MLVSVVVVTYNSSAFVVETLDSIANQSWGEIELIITDDCSLDDTVSICKKWLTRNGHVFTRTEMVEADKNTGVPANVNRGLAKVTGQWACFPAGDDSLKPDCIKLNMEWIASNPEVKVLLSKVDVFQDVFCNDNFLNRIPGKPFSPKSIMAPSRNVESQYRMLLVSDRIHYTPSLFIHTQTLRSVGGFDEEYTLLEDYPLWLNLTKNGIRLHFMDKATVNYRKHKKAINNNEKKNLINPNFFKNESFRRAYTYPNLPLDVRWSQRYIWFVSNLFKLRLFRANTNFNSSLHYILITYLNPFKYYITIKKSLFPQLKKREFYEE
ncbi:alpha-1,3-rhamnosyltransferase [Saccharicrinis carchari]|uniref:Alpha-1,3-rhamnosyltransferase n=1 Tax=Saccharicrinis carchari TaxID=1168039 RepID=A0A521BS26_SACCC|nr:glycosyltransferase [Saccharicrinis carchari]SMO49968.1 alpha-1,3-rhamnosyltransferase [Saccharicrinis carchari]